MPGGRPAVAPDVRFLSLVRPGGGTCILWIGDTSGNGYGRFAHATVQGRPLRMQAHRWAYERLRGPIPEGMTLDHLCRVRNCVNPWHLEPVTAGENVRRGTGPTAVNARKTHCKRGHPFNAANTIVRPTGRSCRTCRILNERARRANRSAAA